MYVVFLRRPLPHSQKEVGSRCSLNLGLGFRRFCEDLLGVWWVSLAKFVSNFKKSNTCIMHKKKQSCIISGIPCYFNFKFQYIISPPEISFSPFPNNKKNRMLQFSKRKVMNPLPGNWGAIQPIPLVLRIHTAQNSSKEGHSTIRTWKFHSWRYSWEAWDHPVRMGPSWLVAEYTSWLVSKSPKFFGGRLWDFFPKFLWPNLKWLKQKRG